VDWEGGQFAAQIDQFSLYCDWVIEPDFINNNLTDPTLMATRWQGVIHQFATPGLIPFAAMGLIAWNFVDPFSGPLECPDPILDSDYDWIARFVAINPTGSALFTVISADSLLISQARRRLGNDKSILLVVASESVINFGVDVRCLLKE
jgi:hypothetical protein